MGKAVAKKIWSVCWWSRKIDETALQKIDETALQTRWSCSMVGKICRRESPRDKQAEPPKECQQNGLRCPYNAKPKGQAGRPGHRRSADKTGYDAAEEVHQLVRLSRPVLLPRQVVLVASKPLPLWLSRSS